jgi:hypothetical protein
VTEWKDVPQLHSYRGYEALLTKIGWGNVARAISGDDELVSQTDYLTKGFTMGYIAHHAFIVFIPGHFVDNGCSLFYPDIKMPDIEAYRQTLSPPFQKLLVGPIPCAANGDYVLALLPDGSKEGWDTSDTGDQIRDDLTKMFDVRYEDGTCPFEMVEVRFGGDDPELGYAIDPRKRPFR